ncbi:hypothetical protein TNCV_455811 [Trichonephila clavipes]|nr:hypothetical protein TNCV_455811 [Trichonephila clavipes]
MAAERTGLVNNHVISMEVYSKKSSLVVRRKQATAWTLSRCLGIGPPVAIVSPISPRLLVFWVKAEHLTMYVDRMLFALLRVKGTSGCLAFWSALSLPGIPIYLRAYRKPQSRFWTLIPDSGQISGFESGFRQRRTVQILEECRMLNGIRSRDLCMKGR